MFRGRWVLVMISLLVSAGCGGEGPAPGLVFPDAAEPGGDSVQAADGVADLEPSDVHRPKDTADDDAPDGGGLDVVEDTGPAPDCETDADCAHLSDDPCTFWFCHPTQQTCKPATFADGDPCDDDDVCTIGDSCVDGVCISGEVVVPPELWDDPCNAQDCDPVTGWHPIPVEGPCDDEDPCTHDDQCVDGLCVGGVDVCTGPECGDGSCDDTEHCESCPQDCGACETNCCEGHGGMGCDDKSCEEIVCGQDVFCCNGEWDDICAQDAVQHCSICGGGPICGDGHCDFGEDCQGCPVDCDGGCDSDCCFLHPGSGCQSNNCEDKVCDKDEFCCVEGWDDYCVDWAQYLCGICN